MAKMTQIQRKRTKRYMAFLEQRNNKQFDIEQVCQVKTNTNPVEKGELNCGATACAVGLMPIYNPKVFEYYFYLNSHLHDQYFVRCVDDKTYYEHGYLTPAIRYFGFNYNQAEYCFSPKSYKSRKATPKTVAKHIKEVLDGKFEDE